MFAKRELVLNIAMNIIGPYIPSPISTFFNTRVTYKFKVLSFIQRKNHLNNLFTLKNILEKGLLCHFLSTVLIVLGLLCCKLLLFRIFLYT